MLILVRLRTWNGCVTWQNNRGDVYTDPMCDTFSLYVEVFNFWSSSPVIVVGYSQWLIIFQIINMKTNHIFFYIYIYSVTFYYIKCFYLCGSYLEHNRYSIVYHPEDTYRNPSIRPLCNLSTIYPIYHHITLKHQT